MLSCPVVPCLKTRCHVPCLYYIEKYNKAKQTKAFPPSMTISKKR